MHVENILNGYGIQKKIRFVMRFVCTSTKWDIYYIFFIIIDKKVPNTTRTGRFTVA